MKTKSFLIIFLFANLIFAQSNIYIPREFQEAIKKGTRTLDGVPGENYWINRADYKIEAEVNPETAVLTGKEIISYHNNSPDSLDRIVIRLYNDIFKCAAKRDYYWGNLKPLPPVKIKLLKIYGVEIPDTSDNVRRGSTNMTVFIKDKIQPKSVATIEIEWELIVPTDTKLRMGNYKNGEMFVAYWYPQIAVYDDVYGWDKIDYQGVVEFYNDPLNNYDVKVTLPRDEIMWATGVLQNGEEVLSKEIYAKYLKAKNSESVVRIIDSLDLEKGNLTANADRNVWHFVAENVPDFSFAIGNSMLWDGKKITVDEKNNKTVFVQAVYPQDAPHWKDAVDVSAQSILILSKELPGVPFPFPEMTSYCNPSKGGGMETPMMANDGAPKNYQSFAGLLFHEISHTYFPFYMGTNERRFSWMDEGWATFFTAQITKKYPDTTRLEYNQRIALAYEFSAGKENDVPPFVPSYSVKFGYPRITFYNRPATAYRELQELLGKELFAKALQEYIATWRGKHPIPTDFFYSFERTVGEDLSWFWKPWFYEFGYPDLSIEKVKYENGKVYVSVKKTGRIPVRVHLEALYSDGGKETFDANTRVWKENDIAVFEIDVKEKPAEIDLGAMDIPDVNRKDNKYILD